MGVSRVPLSRDDKFPKNLGSPWIRPCSLFSKMYNGLFVLMDAVIVLATSGLVSDIIAIGVLGGGCEPQSRGRGGRSGSGMVPLERALVTSIVTFPLSLRVSEILPLLCPPAATFSHPTFSLPQISQFPHVPLGVGGWPLGC